MCFLLKIKCVKNHYLKSHISCSAGQAGHLTSPLSKAYVLNIIAILLELKVYNIVNQDIVLKLSLRQRLSFTFLFVFYFD